MDSTYHGLERLFSPTLLDIVSPFIAFFLVVLLPSAFAMFVIVQVVRGHYPHEDGSK